MSKKSFLNDPRRMSFDSNLVSLEKSDNRKELMDLYDSYQIKVPKSGSVENVTYVGILGEYFIFEGGFKDYVRVENKSVESKYLKNTNIGDNVEVFISEVNEKQYFIRGSIAEIYENKARLNLTNLEEGVSVLAFVRDITPAGYSVDIDFEGVTLPGFMPNTLAGINKLSNSESIIGSKFEVMIESYSRDDKTYIVSRRKYLQSLIPAALKELKNGHVYQGNVTGTTQFGIFVEFNECLTGMIHKTNINPELLDNFNRITPGLPIEFYIKEIIKDKLILTQVLRESLWDTIKIGQVISGRVKDTKPFGSLVILDDETNGLIHTSELEKCVKKPNIGDSIKVKVIAMDRSTRKIFLSVINQ